MTTEEKIKQQFKELQKRNASVFACKVLSIDKTKKTLKVEDSYGIEYPDVRLKSSISDTDAVIKYPLKDSYVLVAMIGNQENDLLVIAHDDVEEIEGFIGAISFKINKDEILLNGDRLGGLAKAKEIKKQVDKNTEVLNQIQRVFNAWTPISQDGGAALKTASSVFTSLPTADLSDIENKNVKHG